MNATGRRRNKSMIALSLLLVVAGCGAKMVKARTAGHIGCPPSKVVIEDFDAGLTTRTWTAKCDDRTFYCSIESGEEYSQMACAPASQPAASPSNAHDSGDRGCQHDQQCKGERICVDGACQSP